MRTGSHPDQTGLSKRPQRVETTVMRKNKISAGLRRLKNAALSREKRREERKRRAALEEFRRKFDPLFIKCMTALEKDGQYIYLVEE